MSDPIKRYVTAVSAGLFLVVGVSGLAMFFGIGEDLVKEMHEWLAVIFVAAIVLHLVRNWSGMMTYVRRGTIVAPVIVALVAGAAFVVPAAISARSNPMPTLLHAMENAKLTDIGRVLDVPADDLAATLEDRGYVVESTDQRLSEIAGNSDQPTMAALTTVLDAKR